MPIVLERTDGSIVGSAAVEVRSAKLEYRSHYREMLEYISEQATALLMELRAPAMLQLIPEPGRTSQTVAQQFAFLRGTLGRRDFQDALQRILAMPHTIYVQDEHERDIRRGFKPTAKAVRQLASRQPRFALHVEHPLAKRVSTLPREIVASHQRETIDTSENRFVKYALSQFAALLTAMERRVAKSRLRGDERLRREIGHLKANLNEVLSHELFAKVGQPTYLPLGSSVLQGRGGYREILRAWLMFSVAARITWEGGDDVYASGKRDVATLYEYWLFFKLLDLFSRKFQFTRRALSELVEKTADTFGLKLKSGRHLPLDGEFYGHGRKLRIRFSYNRTFVRHSTGAETSYPNTGSWTQRMRPDYTLSIWPGEFKDTEAEENELMVHLHFDAKYRVETIADFFGEDTDEELAEAQKAHRNGRTAKREDLLKMHAYRDAIRRTAGAYVLYPGTEVRRWREYHELLPNLGAFTVRPDSMDDGIGSLSEFIDDVILHLCDRASLRERQSYHVAALQSEMPSAPVYVDLSEHSSGKKREGPLGEQSVLALWGGNGGLPICDARVFQRLVDGGMLDPKLIQVAYVLTYLEGPTAFPGLRRVIAGPDLLSAGAVQAAMHAAGHSISVVDGLYAAYHVSEVILPERTWSSTDLHAWGLADASLVPRILPLALVLAS
jgi:predicted component of viral defense system (DUF524 family)